MIERPVPAAWDAKVGADCHARTVDREHLPCGKTRAHEMLSWIGTDFPRLS